MELPKSLNICENESLKNIIISKLHLLKITHDNPEETNESYNISIFKKIKYTIDILNQIIKYLIIRTNNDKYINEIKDTKITIPRNIDKLVLLMSYYDNTFDEFTKQKLYDIISLDFFNQIYSIFDIHEKLIQYVACDGISYASLNSDFIILYKHLIELSCHIFNLNTDFEEDNYIE